MIGGALSSLLQRLLGRDCKYHIYNDTLHNNAWARVIICLSQPLLNGFSVVVVTLYWREDTHTLWGITTPERADKKHQEMQDEHESSFSYA